MPAVKPRGAKFRHRQLTDRGHPPGASAPFQRQHGVVVHHHRTVGRPVDIELNAIGPLLEGARKGGQGILEALARRAAMSDDLRYMHVCSPRCVVVARPPDTPASAAKVRYQQSSGQWGNTALTIAGRDRLTGRCI